MANNNNKGKENYWINKAHKGHNWGDKRRLSFIVLPIKERERDRKRKGEELMLPKLHIKCISSQVFDIYFSSFILCFCALFQNFGSSAFN